MRVHNTTSITCFLEEEAFFPLRDEFGSPWNILQILALGQHFFFHLQRSIPQWLHYFLEVFCSEGLQWLSEGEIFSVRISLSLGRSIGGGIFIWWNIFSHLHPFPVLELHLLPCNSDILSFCIFQPILLGLTWCSLWEIIYYIPMLYEPYTCIYMYWHMLSVVSLYKTVHSWPWALLCSNVLSYFMYLFLEVDFAYLE